MAIVKHFLNHSLVWTSRIPACCQGAFMLVLALVCLASRMDRLNPIISPTYSYWISRIIALGQFALLIWQMALIVKIRAMMANRPLQ